MSIDSNIALGYRAPQFESPVTQAAQAAQLGHAQQQNMLGQLQMAEMARAAQQRNQMRDILSGANAEANMPQINALLEKAYIQSGDIPGLIAHKKSVAEAEAAQAKIQESKAKTKQAEAGTAKSEFELGKQKIEHAWDSVSKASTPDAYKASIDDALAKKLITEQEAANGIQKLNEAIALDAAQGGSQNFTKLRTEALVKLLPAKDQLARTEPKYEWVDLHGKKVRVQTNPNAPGFDPKLNEMLVTSTPHEKAIEAQGRERISKEFGPDNVAHVVTNAQGDVMLLNKQGKQVGPTLQGAGKPSATFEKTAAQQKQLNNDRKLAISELEEITKDGGLIDKSTSSYAGKGVDILARTIGTATPGDIAASQLAPIADLVLKMVPRFEGPQSDKDTASYKQAAGQLNDATLPAKLRKAAGKEILRLMKTRENQFQTPDMASGNVAVPNDIRSQADAIINGGK